MTPAPVPAPVPAALPWRLLAAVYDALPVLALWMLASALVLLVRGNRPFEPFSAGQWLLWLACWAIAGLYAVLSWHRGGQTLGMRPWRLRVVDAGGGRPALGALWLRFAVATLSLAAGGLGFLWSLVDRDRRTWHDIAAGTRLLREPPR
jgi:uncharacterized RDD family membrane protein YckC